MLDEFFEWDDIKAALNERKHAITFEMARLAFKDAFAVERVDTRHGDHEERFALIGMADNHLLFVSYTLRGERIRIISARRAQPHEQRRYHDENRDY